MDYYIADEKDPIIKVYQKIFPGIFKKMSDMPADLKNHLRYPRPTSRYRRARSSGIT